MINLDRIFQDISRNALKDQFIIDRSRKCIREIYYDSNDGHGCFMISETSFDDYCRLYEENSHNFRLLFNRYRDLASHLKIYPDQTEKFIEVYIEWKTGNCADDFNKKTARNLYDCILNSDSKLSGNIL